MLCAILINIKSIRIKYTTDTLNKTFEIINTVFILHRYYNHSDNIAPSDCGGNGCPEDGDASPSGSLRLHLCYLSTTGQTSL